MLAQSIATAVDTTYMLRGRNCAFPVTVCRAFACCCQAIMSVRVQVHGQPHIFAAGDCINVDSLHLAYLGMQHAKLAAHNISALAKAGAEARLKAWKRDAGMPVSVVGMGRKNVVLLTGKGAWTCVPAALMWLKSSSTNKEIGVGV